MDLIVCSLADIVGLSTFIQITTLLHCVCVHIYIQVYHFLGDADQKHIL